jgi:hypothetical protein
MNRINQIIKALSITGIFICITIICLLLSITACKKKKSTEPIVEEPLVEAPIVLPPSDTIPKKDTVFKTFAKFSDFIPAGYSVLSMTYHASSKNLYFYIYKNNTTGYSILQLNTDTKQSLIVFSFDDGVWANNTSVGRRIRISSNGGLYVTGGTLNMVVHRLSGMGNNATLTLSTTLLFPQGANGGSPFDIATGNNNLYVSLNATSNPSPKIVYGDYTLSNPNNFPMTTSLYGTSIVVIGNNLISVRCGNFATLDLRSLPSGTFVRSVAIPAIDNPTLVQDASNRVYLLDEDKILRFSSDLLTKEEFKAIKADSYFQFAIAEETDSLKIFEIENYEVKTMKIKK